MGGVYMKTLSYLRICMKEEHYSTKHLCLCMENICYREKLNITHVSPLPSPFPSFLLPQFWALLSWASLSPTGLPLILSLAHCQPKGTHHREIIKGSDDKLLNPRCLLLIGLSLQLQLSLMVFPHSLLVPHVAVYEHGAGRKRKVSQANMWCNVTAKVTKRRFFVK